MEVAGWGPSEHEGFLPHLESRPVITSIQLVVSGAQNGKREGDSKQAAHLLPGAGWQPAASQGGRGQDPEKAGARSGQSPGGLGLIEEQGYE